MSEEISPEDAIRKMEQMEADLIPQLQNIYRVMGAFIVLSMRQRAPVKTGRLQNSIRFEEIENGIVIICDAREENQLNSYARAVEKWSHFFGDTLKECIPILNERVAQLMTSYFKRD